MLRRLAMSPYVLGLHSHQRSYSTGEWASSRGTGVLHPYTQALMEAIIGEVRRSK